MKENSKHPNPVINNCKTEFCKNMLIVPVKIIATRPTI